MKEYFFTFGLAHPLSNMVQIVIAPDEEFARFGMIELYGHKWGFAYDEHMAKHEGNTVTIGKHMYATTPKDIVVNEDNNVSVVTKE